MAGEVGEYIGSGLGKFLGGVPGAFIKMGTDVIDSISNFNQYMELNKIRKNLQKSNFLKEQQFIQQKVSSNTANTMNTILSEDRNDALTEKLLDDDKFIAELVSHIYNRGQINL